MTEVLPFSDPPCSEQCSECDGAGEIEACIDSSCPVQEGDCDHLETLPCPCCCHVMPLDRKPIAKQPGVIWVDGVAYEAWQALYPLASYGQVDE